MSKNSPSICYTFFAIDDVIVTSVNTYTSMMGISTKYKYLIKFLSEHKKYGAKRLFKCFLTLENVSIANPLQNRQHAEKTPNAVNTREKGKEGRRVR